MVCNHIGQKAPPRPQDVPQELTDPHGRTISYLRLSVTDRCNLRCGYCVGDSMRFLNHNDILTYEEMLTLVDLAALSGVHKLRLTGGEPLVRKDFLTFLGRVRARQPNLDLRLTTNATLLTGKVATLKDFGVTRINISLDTLRPAKYARITGRDFFGRVRAAMDEVLAAGMSLKINAVGMRGVNDGELAAFLELAANHALDIRFIECMPMGETTTWNPGAWWSAEDILKQAQALADLQPLPARSQSSGPARMYSINGGKGRFGVISPLSSHFCGTCNRLRITPDGRLRTCLFSDHDYRLRPILRHPKLGPAKVLQVFNQANKHKPLGYKLLAERKKTPVANRRMSAIGG